MKAVVVHNDAKPVEKDWTKQYAGLDAAVKAQFPAPQADWGVRVSQVFTIASLSWNHIVKAVSDAAKAAGQDGIVIIASGHGGSVDADAGIINWDATEVPGGTHVRDWKAGKVGKGLFWDEPISKYTDPIPFGTPPTLKEEDEDKIRRQAAGWQILKQRHDANTARARVFSPDLDDPTIAYVAKPK